MRQALFITPLLVGCIAHTHRDTNAPGIVDVTKAPADLTDSAPVKPADPGERGVAVQANLTLHGVGWTNVGRDGHEVFLPFGLEIVPWTFTLAESHRNAVASKALDGAVRPAVGLSMRVFPNGDTRTSFGPMWYEAQYTWLDVDRFSGITIGAGLTTTYKHVGPQGTLCMGAPLLIQLCGRGAYTTDEHTTLQLFVTYDGFAEWVWSR